MTRYECEHRLRRKRTRRAIFPINGGTFEKLERTPCHESAQPPSSWALIDRWFGLRGTSLQPRKAMAE
jgi:hypothetical protein